ncbi:MAG: uL15 family ribosomal protein [Nanoarchaeota archaeon]|nr:uL15 family ribosomal protein [Nanoarchaeota archaeon]MBU1644469.1 uL15 family ribosomal protein [Nanoarchaeota archaeon]MBU1976473.1 uL15 family ribosomal protein [Nanoarchaeota archaeon]
MVVHRRKKVTKYRAHTTHGGGHRKKRRGAGSRGGRGRAGSGKRAGHKRFTFVNSLGSKGFTSKNTITVKALNLSYFHIDNISKLVEAGKVTKEGEYYLVDLKELGYNKLLGTGKTNLKLKITVLSCSVKAAEKIKAAGGEVSGQSTE